MTVTTEAPARMVRWHIRKRLADGTFVADTMTADASLGAPFTAGQEVAAVAGPDYTVIDCQPDPRGARWAMSGWYGGRRYNWAQCRFCGHAGADCPAVTCMLCGSVVCRNRPECWICPGGWLPGWSRGYTAESAQCGYAGCTELAVAVVTGRKRACVAHATRKIGAGKLADCLAVRDSGKGWQSWRWLDPAA